MTTVRVETMRVLQYYIVLNYAYACALFPPLAGLAVPLGPIVAMGSLSSTCCESFESCTCIDSAGHSCRFIQIYKSNTQAEREACAPQP